MINPCINTLDQRSALIRPLTNVSHDPHCHQALLLHFIHAAAPVPEVDVVAESFEEQRSHGMGVSSFLEWSGQR